MKPLCSLGKGNPAEEKAVFEEFLEAAPMFAGDVVRIDSAFQLYTRPYFFPCGEQIVLVSTSALASPSLEIAKAIPPFSPEFTLFLPTKKSAPT